MIKKLITLADRLDRRGFKKAADIIDDIIEKYAESEDLVEGESDCDYEVDECHFCYAITDETSWLCPMCKEKAQSLGLSEKQFAYADPDWVHTREIGELVQNSGPVVVEDLSSEEGEEDEKPGRN